MNQSLQDSKPKQKFIPINTKSSEKRDKLFSKEIQHLKKELNLYIADSLSILTSCRQSLDLNKMSQLSNSIQSQK